MKQAVVVFRALDGSLRTATVLERLVEHAKIGMRRFGTPVVAVIRPKGHRFELPDYGSCDVCGRLRMVRRYEPPTGTTWVCSECRRGDSK